jgi:hypothetical protein
MYAAPTLHRTLSLALLMSALLLVVSGCSVGAGTRTGGIRLTAPLGSSVTATAIATPTSTAVFSPTVPAYLLPSAPLLPAGWTWYRDSIGHFQVPLAPGWGVGTFFGDWTPQAQSCKYRIQFFPPGTNETPGQASAIGAPRLIEIER